MRKVLFICLTICLAYALCGCSPHSLPEPEPDVEEPLIGEAFSLKETVRHETFDELLENCGTESVREAMRQFPAKDFKLLGYYTTYYSYDDDHNFPTSVIAFEEGGVTYYFSGAEEHNPFAKYEHDGSDRFYSAKDRATVWVQGGEATAKTGSLSYAAYSGEYAVSSDSPQEFGSYCELLEKVVGGEFRCIRNDVVEISGNTVSIAYSSHDMSEMKYSLSEPGVLKEVSSKYEEAKEEFVNYSDDPEAPGGDLRRIPASVYIDFETVGEGGTILDIVGDGEKALYSVEIAVDEDGDACIVEKK